VNRFISFLLVALLCTGAVAAQEIGGPDLALEKSGNPDEILLKDGNLLRGRIIEERVDLVIFETESLGRFEIPRSNIERIALSDAKAGVFTDPDENTIMFCPTPATLPKGDAYFRDFELFVLNFGFGVTDAFGISFGTLLPVTSAVMFSAGTKLRLVDREAAPIGLALTGSFTYLEETQFGALGAVAGIGNRKKSLNLAINFSRDDDGDKETIYIIGGDYQIGRRSKLFAEYFSSSSLLEDEDEDVSGFLNVGFRIFGERHSFSLSGFRPLGLDSGGLYAFPMVMYSHHF
jgi:hypothetical protein